MERLHSGDYQAIYDRIQNELDEITSNAGVRLRMGVMPSQPELVERFEKERAEINASAVNPWEQVHFTMGCSDFEPDNDRAVIDTVCRADKDMYERKRAKKANR